MGLRGRRHQKRSNRLAHLHQCEQLVPADWQPVNHARAAVDPLVLETLDGSGVAETVYVERPVTATAFFRIRVE